MSQLTLKPLPLTVARFAPYGDVIETSTGGMQVMNEARFTRFNDLARVDFDAGNDGHVAISIARSRSPTSLPYHFDMLERHPLGSQAFVPLAQFPFVIVVAPAGESVDPHDLRAFVTNGAQGINYRRGTWHMPLIAMAEGQEFLVVDRAPGGDNIEEVVLDEPVVLAAP